jgi:ABC-type multidrug transport system permease subunit
MRAVVRRDFLRATSYRVAFVAAGLSEVINMILFYYVSRLVDVEPFSDPDEYFAFVVVGLIALQLAYSVLYFPAYLLTAELVAGTFERLVVSPLGAVRGLIATMVFPFVSAVAGSVAAVAFAVLVFDLSVSWETVPLAIPATGLVGAAFAPFGMALMALVLLIKQAMSFAGWLVTILSLLAGLYFPVALLPEWIQWASDVQPLTPAVDLMRHLIVGTPLSTPASEVLTLAGFAVVLIPPGLWALRAALRTAQRRGTILEY